MNDPCPICGKERGTVVGDFPRSSFCEGHSKDHNQYPMYYTNVGSKNEEKIIELLKEILDEVKTIRHNIGE
jgi:hypothetical protein